MAHHRLRSAVTPTVRAALLLATAVATLLLPAAPAQAAPAAPTRPGTPVVTALSYTSATISWRPSSGLPSQRYDIWYVNASGNGYYNSVVGSTYTFQGLTPGNQYSWFVEPEGASWLPSGTVTFRTPPAPVDSQAPTAPGQPVVTVVSADTATVTWPASTDNIGVYRYSIYRIVGANRTALSGSLTTTATMSMLDWDMDYTIVVTARDVTGNESAPSPAAVFRTQPDVGSSCRYSYAQQTGTGGAFHGIVRFTNTGRFLDGWTLRIAVPAGATLVGVWRPGFQIGQDIVSWHFRGGNYGLPVGGSDVVEYDVTYPGADPAPLRVSLNGHACTPA